MSIDLFALLAIGFTVGFGHCVGMCGGFVLSYTLKVNQNDFIEKPTLIQSLLPHLLYNSGRTLAYMTLGQAVGLLGMIIGGLFKSFQGGVEVFAGVVMVLMGLDFLGYIKTSVFDDFPGISHFKQFVQNLFNRVKRKNILGLGFIMGFIPCGPVYAALAKSAAAANILDSMLSMLFFGLGTFPAMILTGLFADKITTRLKKHVHKIAAILILLLGAFTIVRGIVKIIKFSG
jgi:sulfite exporter TauE/SafE